MNINKTNKIHFIPNQKHNIFNKRSIHLKQKNKKQKKSKKINPKPNMIISEAKKLLIDGVSDVGHMLR